MLIAVSQVVRILGNIQPQNPDLNFDYFEYTQLRKGGQWLTLAAAGSPKHLHLSPNGDDTILWGGYE